MNRVVKYLLLIVSILVLPFSVIILGSSISYMITREMANAIITEVDTEEREGGSTGDRYYYTISRIHYTYTADGREYSGSYDTKGNFSGSVGDSTAVLYDEDEPYEELLLWDIIKRFIYSMAVTALCAGYIVQFIRRKKHSI